MIENSILIQLHHVQDTLIFKTNEQTLDLSTILLPEIVAIVPLLDPTVEIGSNLENILLHKDLHHDHVHDLRSHLEDLLILSNTNSSEDHDNFTENFSKPQNKIQSNGYTTEITNALTQTC